MRVHRSAGGGCGRDALRRGPGVGAVVMLGLAATAFGQVEKVTITGGADESSHNYAWTVTNHHDVAVVSVEFPHYHADMFEAPPGWKKETTFLVNVGVPDRPGVCIARVEDPSAGIARGQSAQFGMRITGAGAHQGRGTVRVRFADGSQFDVTNVELPTQVSKGTTYAPLIALAAIFIVVVVVRERRRRTRVAARPEDDVPGADG